MPRVTSHIVLLWFGISTLIHAADPPNDPIMFIQERVAQTMQAWNLPGLAIAVVKDGETILLRGYGTRTLGKDEPVDPDTLFALGSATKSFTAAAIACLVDEKKLTWDTPLYRHVPEYALFDPYLARELTVRDALAHRTGLPTSDALWIDSGDSTAQLLAHFRHATPDNGFRASFSYNNLVYLTAGEVIAAISNQPWEDFLRDRILQPLDMTRTTANLASIAPDNIAAPHERLFPETVVVPQDNLLPVAPAGALYSTARDMAQWVRLLLANGTLDGNEILSEFAIKEMHSPQNTVTLDEGMRIMYPEAEFLTYGLGWFIHDYRGRKLVEHAGDVAGMSAQAALVPEEGIGLVVLTNLHPALVTKVLMYSIVDAFLGPPYTDWNEIIQTRFNKLVTDLKASQNAFADARIPDTHTSLPLAEYAGVYTSDLLGSFEVLFENDALVLTRSSGKRRPLAHWHLDTFSADWTTSVGGPTYITFGFNARGNVAQFEIADIGVFKRQSPIF